jgi:hypothetical protein
MIVLVDFWGMRPYERVFGEVEEDVFQRKATDG